MDYRFIQKHFKGGARSSNITNMSYSTQIPSMCPLMLGDRVNLVPVTELYPTDNMG